MSTRRIEVGDLVRLKEGISHKCPKGRANNRTAIVAARLPQGGFHMENDLRGCKYWHEDDLELAVHEGTS